MGMHPVGRGKKGAKAAVEYRTEVGRFEWAVEVCSSTEANSNWTTAAFLAGGRIHCDRAYIAVRCWRERKAAVTSSPISEPRNKPASP